MNNLILIERRGGTGRHAPDEIYLQRRFQKYTRDGINSLIAEKEGGGTHIGERERCEVLVGGRQALNR